MQLWCPFAERRPLGPQTESPIGKPRIFIIHTMSGYLAGTDSMFRQGGYSGTESHFGIGGAYDGANDGAVWQWQRLDYSADAQYAGNAYATSVETSDGARSHVRWSAKQAEAIVRVGVWWCQQTGNPARLVGSPGQSGFGYHAQFGTWNHEAHDCPGAVRLKQYKGEIIPEIARRLAGKPTPAPPAKPPKPGVKAPKFPLPSGHWFGPESSDPHNHSGFWAADRPHIRQLQERLRARGWSIAVTGWYDAAMVAVVRKFQGEKGLHVDGLTGRDTWRTAWESPIT
jgi:hypothetical protein